MMRPVKLQKLRDFWESRKADRTLAEARFTAWYKSTKAVRWKNFAELKQTFGTADQVGNCVVFDVGNNQYRLVARINYRFQVIYLLRVMDHKEYDKSSWAEECGCHKPPPKPKPRKQE